MNTGDTIKCSTCGEDITLDAIELHDEHGCCIDCGNYTEIPEEGDALCEKKYANASY